MKKIKITDLLIFIVSAELVGVTSALLSGGFSGMYALMERPPLSPPGWLFPVVWTILYALMGISAFIVYNSDNNPIMRKKGLTAYVVQLVLNFLWSIIFFRFELYTLALIDLILLIVAVGALFYFGIRLNKKGNHTSKQKSQQIPFDDYPKPVCFHKDKGEHHVRKGKEIDPWDRPDIDISKYQRK
jgi:tryptophan-rich sensory protein